MGLPHGCWLCCCLVWGFGQTDLSLVRTLGRFAHGSTLACGCLQWRHLLCQKEDWKPSDFFFFGQVSVYRTSGTKEFRTFLFDVRRCGGIWFPSMNWKPQSQDHFLLAAWSDLISWLAWNAHLPRRFRGGCSCPEMQLTPRWVIAHIQDRLPRIQSTCLCPAHLTELRCCCVWVG
jgi:hypothetical protein